MNKSRELSTTHKVVEEVLIKHPDTRNSDMLLYVTVCRKLNSEILDKPFGMVLTSLKELGLPNLETVRRTRQKIQSMNPELAGNGTVEAHRMLNEEAFKKYATR